MFHSTCIKNLRKLKRIEVYDDLLKLLIIYLV